ncbi:DNA cytosine methyltransferase [Streptomyces sp. SID4928]|uniref:DNA cytosine methyltransferase n=1 Tax=unclassified Streptomyces TaxID=2593676 RepID=UPI0001C1C97C|nr:DNA cytosine methyltransferase [Streptomyces sp. ACT-1]EGE40833.1 C-5 cytosine-specific DNA methylase [Streptomyces sp. ACT-1]MYR48900.1 DNA cytosine methyltransferase [Streptomyces sp. SID4928]
MTSLTTPTAISLCSGVGALDKAVENLTGAATAVYAEKDPWAAQVMAGLLPGVENLGSIDEINYADVAATYPDLDTLIAGWPCQGISNNGHRLGLDDPRSGLWRNVAQAIDVIRPAEVFLENVAALKRRGLDVVADHLNRLGYDLYWTITYASSVGAPTGRPRWLGYAVPGAGVTVEVPAPAPTAEPVARLLPTPKASDGPNGGPNQRDGQGNYYLPGVAVRLDEHWRAPELGHDYGPAIHRWEAILGRPAPAPTSLDARGNPRVCPRFYEWVMGIGAGVITDHMDMPRPQQIKRAGNSVVTLQAEVGCAALRAAARSQLRLIAA